LNLKGDYQKDKLKLKLNNAHLRNKKNVIILT